MSTRIIHRPARTTDPLPTLDPFVLENPPDGGGKGGGMNAMALIPLFGAALSMTVMMLFRGNSLAAVGAIAMGATLLGTLIMFVSQRGKAARNRQEELSNYLEYLERTRRDLRTDESRLMASARASNPPPDALFDILRNSRRLWERRRHHPDFMAVRLGHGERPTRAISLSEAGSGLKRQDTFMAQEAQILQRRYALAPGMPLTVQLNSVGNVSIIGSREFCTNAVRALLIQAAVFHSPEDLQVALAYDNDARQDWSWASWLPHLADQAQPHATGPIRRIAHDLGELSDVLSAEITRRSTIAAEANRGSRGGASLAFSRLIVVADSYGRIPDALPLPDQQLPLESLGITVLYLVAEQSQEPSEVAIRIREYAAKTPQPLIDRSAARKFHVMDIRGGSTVSDQFGELDDIPVASAEAVARALAPYRLSADSLEHGASTAGSESFLGMLGLSAKLDRSDIARLWRPRSETDFLRIPLGPDDRGRPALLDLKESAQFGMGPHGLCVGATGSGKSEMLRSLVVGLLATHPPELLSMVLIDFKGGATFAPFEGAPQVSGIITNLADDASLIERIYASLNGEVVRRQEVLKAAGNIANITDYQLYRQEAKERGEAMEPLPHLVVIIDEFGELLTARPDFIDLFLSIGRIGRSIGVHLLLSSQRIESGKLRGLETYLSYRIGLRTLSESESRTVLDTPDAFHLPPLPGYGYLKVDTTVYTRFKAGYVSGPLADLQEDDDVEGDRGEEPEIAEIPAYAATLGAQETVETPATQKKSKNTAASRRTTGPTVLSQLVDTLSTFPRAVEPIWLPPLPPGISLDNTADGVSNTSQGLRLGNGSGLNIPIGLLDDPAKQWQGVWTLNLTRGSGHLAIIGGPQSGKSTALRTIAASLALTHSPTEVAIYAVDLMGNGLGPLEGLPHVGGVALRTRKDLIRRTIEELLGMLAEREQIFDHYNIDSLATMRRMSARGETPELKSADVFLLLDGYALLNDEFEEIEEAVHSLIARGGGFGVHVITTLNRMNNIRMAQQSFFNNKFELRLADPNDSQYGRKLAETIPEDRPGRVLTDAKLFGQLAMPRIDGQDDPDTMTAGTRDLVAALASSTRERAMPVRVLPDVLSPASVPESPEPGTASIGLRESDLGPAIVDFVGRDPHLMVLGDEESGKTNVLRNITRQLMRVHGKEEIVFAVVDPRRMLADLVPDDYLGGYVTSAAQAQGLATALTSELQRRTGDPEPGTEADVIPRVVLLIDDYDILTAGGNSPLASLAQFLPQSHDVKFSVVLTRRVRGSARGLYESFMAALQDSGGSGLILSGDRLEGALVHNTRARRQPPGRGQLVRAGRAAQTIQTTYLAAEEPVT